MKKMKDENQIIELLKNQSQTDVPSEVEHRLKNRLVEFKQNLDPRERETNRRLFAELLDWLYIPKVRWAVAVAILAGVIILGSLVTFLPQNTDSVYAAVVEQLRSLQSISYSFQLQNGVEAHITMKEPGLVRVKTSWGIEFISDENSQRKLILIHRLKKFVTEKDEDMQFAMGDFIQNDLLNIPVKADEKLGKRVLDGEETVGFRIKQGTSHMDVWIEPISCQLRHVDIDFLMGPVKLHHMEIKNIKINEPVGDSTFELNPPADYEKMTLPEYNLIQSENLINK
ncbi:MAG: hypothetical protein ACOY90_14240 [Candidatus Zhuqueibacterota bacterium]